MNLTLIKAMFCGNFFNADSKYKNHKLVNIISINDETKMAHVVLQRYSIGSATVSTNGKNLINVEIPYSEFKKVNR
jgi:hypothetical protein